ncbi:phosphate uptake regulator, PhoU [Rubellimicrobium thermophilum DSM 16684]|uniref:Phosphate-specific transport system accessory protein PhoU n=1 Tax=Rubellimicrobium thermophilum DSM 16684 TaxID=1123069 RepID=S9QT17_9RHOB|nr:phosphate signaling complex protein PhoU [Rubellimicrobium thermophilum]EPX84501.1 phosphate uptake regulator, PhoU [Rubellimicrobium thermophilum DSM 16684]
MNEPHTLKAYDRDLETLQAHVLKMGGLVEEAIRHGAEALARRDAETADRIRRGDRAIDALEQQIVDEVARIIALRAPMASDLRILLTALRLANSLERMGDYAKNVAKRVTVLASLPAWGVEASLGRMAREVGEMLRDTLDAFVRRDEAMARDVLLRDEALDQMYNALFRELLTFMMEDPRTITPMMHLHFIAKNTERMGDIVTNMAEQVIYLVTGERPREDRPKGDRTAYVGAPDDLTAALSGDPSGGSRAP